MKLAGRSDIEERFIEGNTFDHGRVVMKHLVELCGHLAVERMVTVQKNGVRAPSLGLQGWHGRRDPVGAGLVGTRSDHAPFAVASNNHRLTGKRRIATNLHRHIEGVHINMENRTRTYGTDEGLDASQTRSTRRAARSTPCK